MSELVSDLYAAARLGCKVVADGKSLFSKYTLSVIHIQLGLHKLRHTLSSAFLITGD